ncbi:MAG: SusC/RagA family TonB-linked outer membrane protein, partial [Prevotellaceae bacterium]|nr:SusC/RagA family TonB-linked outer membrane protein [Prevotellaceae bacterium]
DAGGGYTISAPADATLVFSFLGLGTLEEAVNGRGRVDVTLASDEQNLEDVVVVAYGTALREAITGSVSTVSAKKIEKRTLTSITSVLDGNAPGVLVNNPGTPGSSPTIRIRGFSTVNGDNSPLVVVDGVAIAGNITDFNAQDVESISVLKDAASAALFGSRAANGVILVTTKQGRQKGLSIKVNANLGAYSRGIPEYDVLDAKDYMEVMWTGYRNSLVSDPNQKDASGNPYTTATAAIKASQSLVPEFLKYNVFDKPADQLFDQNGKLTANLNPKYSDLDWWDAVERVGLRQEYTVSGESGSDKSNTYFSLGYLDEKSNVKWSDYQRFTGRVNASITPKKWLSAGVNVSGSYQTYSNMSDGNSAYVNPIYYVRHLAPIYPIYLHDPETGDFVLDEQGEKQYDDGVANSRAQNSGRHVIWEMDLNQDKTIRSTLGSDAFVNVKFLRDFNFLVKGNASIRNSENRFYSNAIIGDGAGSDGSTGRTLYRYLNYTGMQQLTWDKSFGKHHADVLLGHENYANSYVYTYLYKTSEVFANAYELVNFTEMTSLDGYDNNLRGESYLSRARYNYDSKYFLEAAFRRDAVSRFHPDNRWGNFWSFGGSWSVHKESFFEPLKDYVNTLKLRASYGEVGNDASAGTYAYMGLYSLDQNARLGAAYKSSNEANDIKWESTNSTSIALEGRAFDRVNFSLEYYNKLSHDLIFSVYNPLSAGATSTSSAVSTQLKNLGDVSNKGFEVAVDVDIYRDVDWLVNASFTGSYQKNEVLTLPEQNRKDGIIDGTKKIMEGHSLYSYWIYQFAGVDQLNGDALYLIDDEKYYVAAATEEAPEDKTAVPEERVRQINGAYYTDAFTYAKRDWSGISLPSWIGSVGANVAWKGLSLSLLCTYSLGGKVFDGPYNSLRGVSANPSAIHKDVLNAWSSAPAGMTETSPDRIDPNGIPAVDWYRYSSYYSASATNHLHDASYLSLRSVNLAYTLPASWTAMVDLSEVTLNLQAENLYTFTSLKGLNPQQALSGVTSNIMNYNRTVSVGLNVKF